MTRMDPSRPDEAAYAGIPTFGKLPLVLVNGILLNGIVGAGIAFSSGPHGAGYWHSSRHGLGHAALSTVALFFWYHFLRGSASVTSTV